MADSKYGNFGGKQPGAGRPLGSQNKATLERKKVEQALHQAIMAKAKKLLKIMMNQAEGEYFLFRIDEKKNDKGKIVKEHVQVKDAYEMKKFFDEYGDDIEEQSDMDGLCGEVNTTDIVWKDGEPTVQPITRYYYIKTTPADWRAIESLFDRVFGKSTQHISTDDGDNDKDNYEQLNDEQLDRHINELGRRIEEAKKVKNPKKENTDITESKISTEEKSS